ncbi:MAG: ABC transporter substrate-binding protein [Cereibacter sphaeroides]|uniref:ABC transporter substrate-binding protein n=1 Tax=Cereibacter sphaeroides TaxID=1063 RepID=A0A2W5TJG2_CERSP|nr:MAG: ABC transporter substrate-binding protein [Cereibacter sphaeroides]
MTSRFAKDTAEIALQKLRSGQIDRRSFMAALGAMGATLALRPGVAMAAEGEVVLCNWGGAAVDAFQEAYGVPFTAKTGMKLVIDGAGPTTGAIRTMVDSGNVIWDTTDGGLIDALSLGGDFLEPIDYAIVDKTKVREDAAQEYGVGNYTFANVLAFTKSKVGDTPPTSWVDFLDFEKYPGKRTMCKWVQGQLEPILLADGVKPEDLYPLDVDRAFAKLEPYLADIIFWEGGAGSQQLFRDGEVVMGNIWHTRANLLRKENPDFDWTWNQNMLLTSAFSVPKGNPAGKKVFDFINSALDPEGQITLLRLMGNGPTNPAAEAMMTDEDRKVNPTSPGNTEGQVAISPAYYAENEADLQNKFLDFIAV